jgi:hypothetical protein
MRIPIILAALILLTACANVSRFEKGPFVAFGQKLDGRPEPLYYLMRMDLSNSKPAETPAFSLKLSENGPPVPWNHLTADTVSAHLPKFVPPPVWPKEWKAEAAKRDAYEGAGYYIAFRDGRLEYLGLCSHCGKDFPEPAPGIGPPDGSIFFRLPVTKEQLVRVVGEPDRVYKVSEVRY